MRKDYQIAFLLFFSALLIALAGEVPVLLPDATLTTLRIGFLIVAGIAALLVVAAIVVATRDDGTGKSFPRWLWNLIVATGLVILFCAAFFWPRDAFSQSMPGFSNYSVLRNIRHVRIQTEISVLV